MGSNELGLAEMTDVMVALNNYRELGGYMGQIDRDQMNTIKPWHDKQLEVYGDRKAYGNRWYNVWADIDMHVVKQIWSSTSCGWGGIGGAAMTNAYTVIIVNYQMKAMFVYWSGKLAYIAHLNDKVDKVESMRYVKMPGLSDCNKVLDIIYKIKR